MIHNYNGGRIKQYLGVVVSLPVQLNYRPLSHENSPNDRMQRGEVKYVLVFSYIILYCACVCEREQNNELA